MTKEIKLGRMYRRKDDGYLAGVVPEYIIIAKIINPDSLLDYTRYRYYDIKNPEQLVKTYFTYDDIEGMYKLVEDE